MRLLTIALLLIASTVYGADQKVLDFCYEYIGEAIKAKPDHSYMIPIPQHKLQEFVQPIHRTDKSIFSNISTGIITSERFMQLQGGTK